VNLTRNIVWNVLGIALPVLVGILVVPQIVRGLGTERFGFLSIVWVLIGYFSIFDLGLGRSLTRLAADRLAKGRPEEVAPLASTAMTLVGLSGVVASVAVAVSAGWIARRSAGTSSALVSEAFTATLWLAVSLPFVLLSTALSGLLEAYQKFGLINAVRIPVGILMLVTPLTILPVSKHLGPIVAALAGLRVVNTGVLFWLVLRNVHGMGARGFGFRRDLIRPLATFGGWLSVSNVLGPLMVYFDRFLIAAVLGASSIAYYTVPYDMLTRLWLIPTAMQGVLFPTFTAMHGRDSARLASLFARSSQTTMLLLAAPLLATMLLAHQALNLWIGPLFAEKSTAVSKILMIGVLANSLARTPSTFVQGAGYAKWTAVLHALELPGYGLALWVLLGRAGINGAACACSGRILIDTLIVYFMATRLEPKLVRPALRDVALLCVACLTAAWLGWVTPGLIARITLVAAVAIACTLLLLKHTSTAFLTAPKRPSSPGAST
jgi:O-antigen/teichoic acid export membrane protein